MLPMRSKGRERKGPPKATLGQDADAINEISRILISIFSICMALPSLSLLDQQTVGPSGQKSPVMQEPICTFFMKPYKMKVLNHALMCKVGYISPGK